MNAMWLVNGSKAYYLKMKNLEREREKKNKTLYPSFATMARIQNAQKTINFPLC